MRARDIRKTKLIATIGPACDGLDTIKAMIHAGMNVARPTPSTRSGSRWCARRRASSARTSR
jgi:pyruvate kinase